MTDAQIMSLRLLADDPAAPGLKRIRALDVLAADCGLYRTNETLSQTGVPRRKAIRFVVQGLKRLRKAARLKPKYRSAVESRILFISGVTSVSDDLFAATLAPGMAGPVTSRASSEADEIRRLLAEHGHKKEETCR